MQNSYHQRRGRQGPPVKIVPLPGQVSFRVICHTSSIGGVIGSSGSIVSQLRRETSSRIHCEEPVRGSDHRVILIVGSGSVEKRLSLGGGEVWEVSCAQEAMIRVFERVWEVEAERERGNANARHGEEEEAYCGLLADSAQIGFVVGKGGKNIVRMRAESGAKIWILPPPPCGRTTDQLIQITGGTLAVKRALVAVSGYLQAFPSMDKEPTPMSTTPTERPLRAASPDSPEELFPNLSSLLPPILVSNANFSSVAADGDSKLDSNGKQKVLFRMLCSNVAAGAIIGKKAGIVRALQYQTGASILFDSPETEYRDRVVTISALENLESGYSPAQNALVLVFARSVESDIEKGFPSGLSEGTAVTFRLLVSTDLVSCLKNKEGSVLSEIVELPGADVEILVEELSLGYSPENVVQITGDYKSVQNAIFQVTNRLRDNLLPPEKLNEIKSSHEEVRGTALSQALLPTTPILDNEHRPNLTQRIHPGHSENSGPQPVVLLPQKSAGNGHTDASQGVHHGSTTFGGSFDLERSLDFLLPRDMLNEVGGTSPYKGGNVTTFPSSLQTLGSPLVSDQESALTRAMSNIGLFDDADCPSESQLFEIERRHGQANADGKGGLELESQSKSIMVKSTSVEIVVHADAFGSIYGKNGCNLARLKEISGAKVEVHDPRPGETEGIVLISGTPDQTLVAQSLLQAFIQDNHLST